MLSLLAIGTPVPLTNVAALSVFWSLNLRVHRQLNSPLCLCNSTGQGGIIMYQLDAVCNKNLKSFLIVFDVIQNSNGVSVILCDVRLLLHLFTRADGDCGCC